MSTYGRLNADHSDLAQRVEEMPEDTQRDVALKAARAAVEATNLRDPRVDAAMTAAAAGRLENAAARSGVADAERELDERAWPLMEDADRYDEYLLLFRQARAAAAVRFLFESLVRG